MKRIILGTLMLLGVSLGTKAQQLSANIQETTPGRAWTLAVSLTDVSGFTALSMKMDLPAGLQAAEPTLEDALQSSHQLVVGKPADALWNVILYSPQSTLLGETDVTFTIQLQASVGLGYGQYTLPLTDIRLADAQGVETKLEDMNVVLQNSLPDAISLPQAQRKEAPVFTLDGRRVTLPLRPGIYVSQGRKFVVK